MTIYRPQDDCTFFPLIYECTITCSRTSGNNQVRPRVPGEWHITRPGTVARKWAQVCSFCHRPREYSTVWFSVQGVNIARSVRLGVDSPWHGFFFRMCRWWCVEPIIHVVDWCIRPLETHADEAGAVLCVKQMQNSCPPQVFTQNGSIICRQGKYRGEIIDLAVKMSRESCRFWNGEKCPRLLITFVAFITVWFACLKRDEMILRSVSR